MNRVKIKSCKDEAYTEGIGADCLCKRVVVELTIVRDKKELDRLNERIIAQAVADGLWRYTSKNKAMINDSVERWDEWAENGDMAPILSMTPQQANRLLFNK